MLKPIANGINPNTVVIAVNSTGRNLALPPFTMASKDIPCLKGCLRVNLILLFYGSVTIQCNRVPPVINNNTREIIPIIVIIIQTAIQ
jgi:hypothetical protein